MDIFETIQRIKTVLEDNGVHVDKAVKAQHWLYRSSNKIHNNIDEDLIVFLSEENKRELYRLCDDLSYIKETIGDLEKIVMNELNCREFGTAEHTREWW
jgi:hypothetical protein